MEKERTRLVEDGNTIYEIDMDCMKRKRMEQEKKCRLQYQSGCAMIKNSDCLRKE